MDCVKFLGGLKNNYSTTTTVKKAQRFDFLLIAAAREDQDELVSLA